MKVCFSPHLDSHVISHMSINYLISSSIYWTLSTAFNPVDQSLPFDGFIYLAPGTPHTQVFFLPLELLLTLLDYLLLLSYISKSWSILRFLPLWINPLVISSLTSLSNSNMLSNTKFIFPAQTSLPNSRSLPLSKCLLHISHKCLTDILNLFQTDFFHKSAPLSFFPTC